MFQFHVSHVSWPCGYFILVILLPCCHVSRYETQVAFTCYTITIHNTQVWNIHNWKMLHMHVPVTKAWWDRWCTCLWNEMQLVEAKHLGCYKPSIDSLQFIKLSADVDNIHHFFIHVVSRGNHLAFTPLDISIKK